MYSQQNAIPLRETCQLKCLYLLGKYLLFLFASLEVLTLEIPPPPFHFQAFLFGLFDRRSGKAAKDIHINTERNDPPTDCYK